MRWRKRWRGGPPTYWTVSLSGDNKPKHFAGTLQSHAVRDGKTETHNEPHMLLEREGGNIDDGELSVQTKASLEKAWTVLHTSDYLRDEEGLNEFLADLGVRTAEDLHIMPAEDIIKVKSFLKKIGEIRFSSLLSYKTF